MKEIEILMEVKDSKESTLAALQKFEYTGTAKVLDIYFYDPLRSDLKPDSQGRLGSSLRIRVKEGTGYLTYKLDKFDGDEWSHSDEYETQIIDPHIGIEIMAKLGFDELIRIENEKHTYVTDEYEIVFEDVKDLGLFIEVEKISQVDHVEVSKTKEEIRLFLESLNISLGKELNAGKPELVLRKKNLIK